MLFITEGERNNHMELFTELPQQTIYTAVIENVTVGLLWECESYNRGDQIENMICSTHHAHAYMELFACHSGQVVISTENDALILHAGDAAIIPANIPHVKRRENTFADCSVIGIVIGRRYTRGCFNLFRILSGISQSQQILIFRDRPSLCSAVTSLTDHSDGNPALPALRLTLLLSEIAGELKEKDHRENTPHSLRVNELDRSSKLDFLIDSCFMNDLTDTYVANQLYISERQLSRMVKKRYGTTLHQALQNKRLTVAAKMLKETELSASAVAQEIGFRSICSFYRVFRTRYGMTPTEYRQQTRAEASQPTESDTKKLTALSETQ